MGNTLIAYLNKRLLRTNSLEREEKPPGPVITISRQVGCSGLELAYALADRLNKTSSFEGWKVLSKEILHHSARELDVDPERISKIFKQTDRTSFDEILNAFTEKRYKSDKKIKRRLWTLFVALLKTGFASSSDAPAT